MGGLTSLHVIDSVLATTSADKVNRSEGLEVVQVSISQVKQADNSAWLDDSFTAVSNLNLLHMLKLIVRDGSGIYEKSFVADWSNLKWLHELSSIDSGVGDVTILGVNACAVQVHQSELG